MSTQGLLRERKNGGVMFEKDQEGLSWGCVLGATALVIGVMLLVRLDNPPVEWFEPPVGSAPPPAGPAPPPPAVPPAKPAPVAKPAVVAKPSATVAKKVKVVAPPSKKPVPKQFLVKKVQKETTPTTPSNPSPAPTTNK